MQTTVQMEVQVEVLRQMPKTCDGRRDGNYKNVNRQNSIIWYN